MGFLRGLFFAANPQFHELFSPLYLTAEQGGKTVSEGEIEHVDQRESLYAAQARAEYNAFAKPREHIASHTVPVIIDDGVRSWLRINRPGQPPEDILLNAERLAAMAADCANALRREVQRRG